MALTKIVEADPMGDNYFGQINFALMFILLACIFDLFDGRVARWGGAESPFGREFDSLADLISFGVAPAFLVHRIVLRDVFVQHPELGWFIASIYLICGAFRLARFNVLSTYATGGGKDFVGFPIPSAAALVASLTSKESGSRGMRNMRASACAYPPAWTAPGYRCRSTSGSAIS